MSLSGVKMSDEVWLTCVTHALSTESEEIMGLLLGDIEVSENGSLTAVIWGASPQSRSDRRKDRVETNPEQLAAASAQAERITTCTGKTTRVIGWYHSHPHITVFPSHVDVRTQAMYQLLDPGFIGLIFSCFSEDVSKVGRIQVIAFQSADGKKKNDIVLMPSIIDVESSLTSSETASGKSGSVEIENEQDIGDSRDLVRPNKSKAKASSLGLKTYFDDASSFHGENKKISTDHQIIPLNNSVLDTDLMDMSASMQEAMHRSNLDISGAEFIGREIPLHVLPSRSLVKLDSPMVSFVDLQRILYKEEQSAYNQELLQNMRDGKMHPLAYVHHTATYQASICKLIEYCLSPTIGVLQDRLKESQIRLEMLMDEAKCLEAELGRFNETSSRSSSTQASSRSGSLKW